MDNQPQFAYTVEAIVAQRGAFQVIAAGPEQAVEKVNRGAWESFKGEITDWSITGAPVIDDSVVVVSAKDK